MEVRKGDALILHTRWHRYAQFRSATDRPMNLPIGRFLGRGQFEHCDRVRAKDEEILGGRGHVCAGRGVRRRLEEPGRDE